MSNSHGFGISETAQFCGVSVRTLHYYDEIGLACPSEKSEAGYRFYNADAVARLQEVIFYRELGLSLDEIAKIVASPDNDRTQTLIKHRSLLELKRERLDGMIEAVDSILKGEPMSNKKKITAAEIDAAKEKYAEEVRQKWGASKEYEESEKRFSQRTDGEKETQADSANAIFAAFAEKTGCDPADEQVQKLVARWQQHITEYYYECTKPILACLGQMYTADERFTENLDSFGAGTAELMSKAIEIYCAQ